MVARLAVLLLAAWIANATELRIGVLSLFRPERVSVRASEPLTVQAGTRSFSLAPGQVLGLRAVGAEIDVFAQQQPSTANRVVVSGRGGAPVSFRLTIDGKIDRSFHGRLEAVALASRLEPVVLIEMEAAVAAVVAAELPRDAPMEAMQTLAVLARSYYAASGRRHGAYDFCDTTHCQWRRETVPPGHPASVASRQTEHIVVFYGDRILPALYHASCGGETRTAEQVGLAREPYPYFPVVCDACRREAPAWSRRLPADAGSVLLKAASEANRLAINRQLGWSTLPSNLFEARLDGSEVVVNGRGEGHGLGVCQRGTLDMARRGATFRDILSHYLPQTRSGSSKPRF